MRKTTGHVIRISGLLIELLGIWSVFNVPADSKHASLELPGGTVLPLAWLAVGLGFVLWFTGTLLVYAPRFRQKPVPNDQRELQP